MKISYRTHPVLKMFDTLNERGFDMPRFNSDAFFLAKPKFAELWFYSKIAFGSQISIISKTFNDAAELAYKSLHPIFLDMVNEGDGYTCKGTYIMGEFVYMLDYVHVDQDHSSPNNKLSLFVFLKSGEPILYSVELGNKIDAWFSQEIINGTIFGDIIKEKNDLWKVTDSALIKCVLCSMFKTYANVEVKHLPAGHKIKEINCKYINETEVAVVHLDCAWFTTFVKSDGFDVRGHFRLQPKKKEGKWTKEIVWINPFHKEGYVKKAGILNHLTPLSDKDIVLPVCK